MTLDPIQLALTQNRLDYITRQMGEVMVRTARSPIFSQAHDFTCFVCGPDGWLVSQADGIPIHSGGGGFAVRAVLRDFADDIEPGDVFVLNDPWQAGGNHLPDWVIARPGVRRRQTRRLLLQPRPPVGHWRRRARRLQPARHRHLAGRGAASGPEARLARGDPP